VYYERKKQGITLWFWRCFQGLAGCETDKDFVPCEKTFEGAEGEEGFAGGGEMILLFDDGGNKVVNASSKGYSVGKFTVNKIWATDLTGMAGTRVDKYNSIKEALSDLAKKGPDYSSIFSDEGIEVALTSPDDMNVILVKKYHVKAQQNGAATSMKLVIYKENWNKYSNTGVTTDPTTGWVDNTKDD
jgi:hypothetical protein